MAVSQSAGDCWTTLLYSAMAAAILPTRSSFSAVRKVVACSVGFADTDGWPQPGRRANTIPCRCRDVLRSSPANSRGFLDRFVGGAAAGRSTRSQFSTLELRNRHRADEDGGGPAGVNLLHVDASAVLTNVQAPTTSHQVPTVSARTEAASIIPL